MGEAERRECLRRIGEGADPATIQQLTNRSPEDVAELFSAADAD